MWGFDSLLLAGKEEELLKAWNELTSVKTLDWNHMVSTNGPSYGYPLKDNKFSHIIPK